MQEGRTAFVRKDRTHCCLAILPAKSMPDLLELVVIITVILILIIIRIMAIIVMQKRWLWGLRFLILFFSRFCKVSI